MQSDNFYVKVEHWEYRDGWNNILHILLEPGGPTQEFFESTVGWHCWVYTNDNELFNKWMRRSMIGEYESIFRFNSGDPMHTIHITSDIDANVFKLRWL